MSVFSGGMWYDSPNAIKQGLRFSMEMHTYKCQAGLWSPDREGLLLQNPKPDLTACFATEPLHSRELFNWRV